MSKEAKKPLILLAEDDEAVRGYILRLLKKNGYDVMEARDGKEAQDIYLQKENEIDAIISDLRMPNVNGIEFAEFNYRNKFLPFIVCTAVSDAKLALELFKIGVQDYLVKPVKEQSLIGSLKLAASRRSLRTAMKYDENPYAGNVGSISIPSKSIELKRASNWIENHVKKTMLQNDWEMLINYVDEFLMNSHEHGNLGIGETEKAQFIEAGTFETELESREIGCTAKINIGLSVLKDEVAIYIADQGKGFDYDKYLHMTEEYLLERIALPNGRGIFMASKYFDSIQYSNNGANVLLIKRFEQE